MHALKVIGVGLIMLLGVAFVAAMANPKPAQSPTDRIDEACAREYGADQSAVVRCRLALYEKAMDDDRADRINRAAQSAGVKP